MKADSNSGQLYQQSHQGTSFQTAYGYPNRANFDKTGK
ncbi:hypothetical protein F528_0381 [Neisseria meningitidis 992008]|uniref:Uncharacterized protein n=1 Tax=Neisseria meningitidis alpha522 TaxID=996307 RepID=I4E3H7_NEIME|nr:hypothetical protein F528_0381 [Neisseria meningitidis 992008]CCA43891.1 hypothetical protein NMALPHA522_0350 [Neisseria meningitidis alpha522]